MEYVLLKAPCRTYGKLLLIWILTGRSEAEVMELLVQDGVAELIEAGYLDEGAYREIFEPEAAGRD